MSPSLRTLLVGSAEHDARRRADLLLVAAVFGSVFAAYAVGVFRVSGGVVWLAGGAAVVAYRGEGLALAWAVVYAALLGYNADHYLLGLSGRPVAERLVALLEPDGLAFVAVEALVLGTLAWVAGTLVALAVDAVRDRRPTSGPE
jgi:small neutral amino acid transporter SnatA (MarC family)